MFLFSTYFHPVYGNALELLGKIGFNIMKMSTFDPSDYKKSSNNLPNFEVLG